jgi:uncharacterized protein involved in propanediol utilization
MQGVFEDGTGALRHALVTVPRPAHGSQAVFRPSEDGSVVVQPARLSKAQRAAELTVAHLAALGVPTRGGQVTLSCDVPTGVGMGSSTSDVVATIKAVADFHGEVLAADDVARLAVQAEGASDSIMIEDRVVLFGQRDGVVLETFGHVLPPMIVLGCDTDRDGHGVDTLGHPVAEYSDRDVAGFGVLRAALRRAVTTADVALLGRVATASARINQRFLPTAEFGFLLDVSRRFGAAGVQVAHSGTVAGLIFDATSSRASAALDRSAEVLVDAGLIVTGPFVAGPPALSMWKRAS